MEEGWGRNGVGWRRGRVEEGWSGGGMGWKRDGVEEGLGWMGVAGVGGRESSAHEGNQHTSGW